MKLVYIIAFTSILALAACSGKDRRWKEAVKENRDHFNKMDQLFSTPISSEELIKEVQVFKTDSNVYKYCAITVFDQKKGYAEYDSQIPDSAELNVLDIIDSLKYNSTDSYSYHSKDDKLLFNFEVYESKNKKLQFRNAIRVRIMKMYDKDIVQGASYYSDYPILYVAKLY